MARFPASAVVRSGVLVGLAGLLLSGCASVGLRPDQPLKPDTGLVVVRVADHGGGGALWEWLELWSIDRKEVRSLDRLDRHTNERTSLFVGALPPGSYRLDAAKRTTTSGRIITTTTAPLHERLGTFRVVAGQATDLGTVLLAHIGLHYLVGQVTAPGETAALLQRRLPAIAADVLQRPLLGWEGIPDEDFKRRLVAVARGRASRLNEPRETPWGEVVAGSELGQVLVRGADGRWASRDTGHTVEISMVLPLASGELLALGDEGLLLLSADRGRSWSRLRPPAGGLVDHVTQGADGRYYLVMWLPEAKVHVLYRAGDPRNGSWEEVRRFDQFGWYYQRASLLTTPTLALSVLPNGLVVDEGEAGEWRKRLVRGLAALTTPANFDRLRARADGVWYGTAYTFRDWQSRGYGANKADTRQLRSYRYAGGRAIVASRDRAASWETLASWEPPAIVWDVLFTDATTGYALLAKEPLKGDIVLVTSADGGKSWVERGKLPVAATALFTAERGRVLLAAAGGAVVATRDGGRSWSVERTPSQAAAPVAGGQPR